MPSRMDPIESKIRADDPEFRLNDAANRALADELKGQLARARQGGDAQAHERHRQQHKLFVRDRIDRLLDPGSPFLELSPLAAHGMYEGEAPAAGMVTGIGRVSERECMIVANDATVKGGTYYPMTVK